MSTAPASQIVTPAFVQAPRVGVVIRTPIENITHFGFADKYCSAFTKSNGEFILNISLHEIADIFEGQAIRVHRSYVVMHHALASMKMLRQEGKSIWFLEALGSISHGGRCGIQSRMIPIARAERKMVRRAWEAVRA
jgi:DNA-binding LytR/AlgR family response regulator